MDKLKLCSGSVYGKSCYDKSVLKDVFYTEKRMPTCQYFQLVLLILFRHMIRGVL